VNNKNNALDASCGTPAGLKLTADPFHMKIISDAISDYMLNNDYTDDTTLSDFCYALDSTYQEHHGKENDDFDLVESDRHNLKPRKVLQSNTKLNTDSKEVLQKAEDIKIRALKRFHERAYEKYDAGQREHGGLITERVTLKDLEDEIIDLWFYLSAYQDRESADT
jgi:hypothetical protein